MRSYRWDKRREDKQKRQRFAGFTVFDSSDLVIIFCLGLLFFYTLLSVTLSQNICLEQVTNFGASATTMPVFKAMYFVSLTLLAYWASRLVMHVFKRARITRFIWDGITGLGIILMMSLYFNLTDWSNASPPDGTLGISDGVWVHENGELQWRKFPRIQIPLKNTNGKIEYYPEYRSQECVWLDANKVSISQRHSRVVDNYDGLLKNIRLGERQETVRAYNFVKPDTEMMPTFSDFILRIFRKKSYIQDLTESQYSRDLTVEERSRFIKKQECLKQAFTPYSQNMPRWQIIETCDPSQIPPRKFGH